MGRYSRKVGVRLMRIEHGNLRCECCGKKFISLRRVWVCDDCYAKISKKQPTTLEISFNVTRVIIQCSRLLASIIFRCALFGASNGMDRKAMETALKDIQEIEALYRTNNKLSSSNKEVD